MTPFFIIGGADHVVNPGDKNFPIWSNELPQEGDEVGHWFMHGAPKDARVEVTSWTADFDEDVCHTTEAISDARSTGVEPVVIRLKGGIIKDSGASEQPKLTMQTASTAWNQPSFPFACSAAMN